MIGIEMNNQISERRNREENVKFFSGILYCFLATSIFYISIYFIFLK